MANQSINAVKIIPNDNINLPEPGIKTSGASTTGTAVPVVQSSVKSIYSLHRLVCILTSRTY